MYKNAHSEGTHNVNLDRFKLSLYVRLLLARLIFVFDRRRVTIGVLCW